MTPLRRPVALGTLAMLLAFAAAVHAAPVGDQTAPSKPGATAKPATPVSPATKGSAHRTPARSNRPAASNRSANHVEISAEAESLLEAVSDAYHRLSSYDIVGSSRMIMSLGGVVQTADVPFRLAAAKP